MNEGKTNGPAKRDLESKPNFADKYLCQRALGTEGMEYKRADILEIRCRLRWKTLFDDGFPGAIENIWWHPVPRIAMIDFLVGK